MKLADLDNPTDIRAGAVRNSALGRFGQFITRWGADPIHLSGQLEDLISADRFGGFTSKVSSNLWNRDLLLTLAESERDGSSASGSNTDSLRKTEDVSKEPALPVCVLVYEPHFDSKEGLWYCDIDVDHGASYFPFVQLGLVRYQVHAVSGLELSHPVSVFTRIPPTRQGHVTFISDRDCVWEVSGVGYHQSETGTLHDGDRSSTDYPFMNATLMKASGNTVANGDRINWQPVVDRKGVKVQWTKMRWFFRAVGAVPAMLCF